MENIIDPKKTALIVFDMLNNQVKSNPERYKWIQEHRVVENMVKIATRCRETGVPVIFVNVQRRPDAADVANVITDEVLEGRSPLPKERGGAVEGTWGGSNIDELQPQPGDFVVVKRRSCAFYNTPLEIYLRNLGADTVLIGGVATDRGIEATVRNGRDRDYNMVVLHDCCASYDPADHDWCIKKVFPRLARVMTADQALKLMAQHRG